MSTIQKAGDARGRNLRPVVDSLLPNFDGYGRTRGCWLWNCWVLECWSWTSSVIEVGRRERH